jgi:adenylate cyclase
MPSRIPTTDILDGCSVLLVDDSYLVFRALQRIFRRVGMETFFAQYASEALDAAIEHKVDAIVLDINMSDSNGLELCKEIRAHPETQDTPIIIITATSDPDQHVGALNSGADDFVSKPPNQKVLLRRIATLVSQRRAADENQRLMRELERYISSAAVSEALLRKGVQSIEATILFSDMRGFTAASFDHDTADVFNAINLTMSFQTEIVKKWGGYVDGFSGDGMLAVFDCENAPIHACKAAREIIERARVTEVPIWDPLPIGIGINCGTVIRGDLGSETRRAHTVIGSTVNVSARLCGVAKGLEAVASHEVVQRVGAEFSFNDPQLVRLKGLPEPVYAYSMQISPDLH